MAAAAKSTTRALRAHGRRLARTLGAASCVREPVRFVVRELSGRRSQAVYRLRGSGLLAPVRHPLLDMWVLEEIFRFGVYAPPPQVLERLRAAPQPVRVLDLGGHAGYFVLYLLGLLGRATVVSLEPDPRNVRALRRTVQANGLGSSWTVIEAAAATADGRTHFESGFQLSRISAPDSSLAATHDALNDVFPFLSGSAMLDRRRVEVETRDALPLLADADLVKMDIEGGEWDILADARFADMGAAALVLEYHPRDGDVDAARAEAHRHLEAAGFRAGAEVPSHDAGLLWAWRETAR